MSEAPLPAVRDDTAPALLEQAERALALVSTADAAEDLYRKLAAIAHAARLARVHSETQLRAGKLKLRAERRWGELLGPAEIGRPDGKVTASNFSSRDKVARHRARQVYAVPEEVFERYLATVNDAEMLRRARLLRVAREAEPPPDIPEAVFGDVEIRHGDLRSALDDLTGSVDAIITDPPYAREFLDEYDALGALAARLLRPGGVLAVMVGQTYLPEYLARIAAYVPYRWCGAYLTEGPATRVFGRRVGTKWKPILIFGSDAEFLTQDVFRSRGDDKQHHHWGQSESGVADIVERLTEPGALVVDPFVGGGTTAVVCRDLGRRFVGCDVDADAVARTKARLV